MAHMAYMKTDKKAVKTIENLLKREDLKIKGHESFVMRRDGNIFAARIYRSE